jgi:cytoskeletal protein CcmA (bactofilin family)
MDFKKKEAYFEKEEQTEEVVQLVQPTPQKTSNLVTVIQKGTIIDGNLRVEGNVEVHGEVNGNVTCNTHVTVFGTVKGNIVADSGHLNDGFVIGNVSIKQDLFVGTQTEILGDVQAKSFVVNGKVKGSCSVSDTISINNSGVILGDIVTGELVVEKGAVIQGNIKINRDVFFESEDE